MKMCKMLKNDWRGGADTYGPKHNSVLLMKSCSRAVYNFYDIFSPSRSSALSNMDQN